MPKLLRRFSASQLESTTTALSASSATHDKIKFPSCEELETSNEDQYGESDADCSSAGDEAIISRRDERDIGQSLEAWGTFV